MTLSQNISTALLVRRVGAVHIPVTLVARVEAGEIGPADELVVTTVTLSGTPVDIKYY